MGAAGPLAEPPACPRGLLKAVKEAWASFWSSPLAEVVESATDAMALSRLFSLYDERERAYRAYRKDRLVVGSQGQMVLNPLGKHMATLDAEIRQLEDRFGLTPMARLKLGITFGDAHRSLEELNRSLAVDDDEDEDPRLHAIDTEADAR